MFLIEKESEAVRFHAIRSINKLGCRKAKDVDGYKCDVEMDRTLPWPTGRIKSVEQIRFIKGDNGWIPIEN